MVANIEATKGSKNPEPDKDRPADLRALVDKFEKYDKKVALINFTRKGSDTWTYKKFAAEIKSASSQMQKEGLKKEDKVVFFAPNSPAWIICALATIYSGATLVPVDSQQSDEVLKHILKDSEAAWIFTDDKGHKRLEKIKAAAKLKLLLLDKDDAAESWKKLGKSQSKTAAAAEPVHAKDVAVLFYTSGTTGMPKGVPLTHANMLLQIDSIDDMKLLSPSDRVLLPLPLFHVYPLNIGLLVPFSLALPIILPHSLTGPEIMRSIKEGKVTVLVGVPRLLRSLYKSIEDRFKNPILNMVFETALHYCRTMDQMFNLRPGRKLFAPIRKKIGPTLRLFTCGGAPLEAELASKLRALGWEIAVGYGLSETAPLLTLRMPQDRDLAGVGKPIKGVEVKIVEAKEKDDQVDKDAGEIIAHGANVFSGYLNRPDLNKEAFTADGWFKTGDLGVFRNGELHVIGRASSTIVMEGGEKIQPENVEDTIAKQAGIAEIGLLQKDHKLVALVVPDRKVLGDKDAKEVVAAGIKAASSSLASYLQITDFALTTNPLPRTNLGKIKRFELKELYEKCQAGEKSEHGAAPASGSGEVDSNDQTLTEEPAAQTCLKWLKGKFPDKQITLDTSPQLDLNIDSLEWMNLTLELMETTGVELTGDAIARVNTVRDLLKEISASGTDGDALSPLEDPEAYLNEEQKEFLKPLSEKQKADAHTGYEVIMAFMKPFRVEAVGLDHLTAKQYVFTPNHTSYIDAFAITAALPYERLTNTQWAGWSGIAFGNPVFSFLSRLARVFPIEAKQSLFASLALGVSVLRLGSNLVWFPEGERTLTGELLPFKKGIGLLLEKSDIPVVPVYLAGTRQALPPGAFFPTFHKITVIFGEPVKPGDLAKEGKGEGAPERIANALQSRVQALAPK